MSLAAFALRYKTIVCSLVALIMVWGVYSYFTMPRREDPEYTVRTCLVTTSWPGTPAEKVEELITKPLEDEIDTLDGIRWIRSDTWIGLSAIYVEVERAPPPSYVVQMWDSVRARVERVPMPESWIKPVVIDDFGQTNILMASVHQAPLPGDDKIRDENRYSDRELYDFADRLKDELKLLDGVAKVELEGVRREAIYIETDLGTWSQLALTSNGIQKLLSARNVIDTGGQIDADVGRLTLSPTGNLDTVHEIDSILVGSAGEAGSPIYLSDLGVRVVRDYEDPPSQLSRYGDTRGSVPCVNVAFTMKGGKNITKVCADARALLERLSKSEKMFPPDIELSLVHDVSENVDAKIQSFFINVVEAVLIVVIVVFLMVGFRSAVVMAGNIPIVVLGSIALITLFGVQLEQISIAAMIIALGMLVDNAVQICDQSRRLQSEGMSPHDAAVAGANQLSFPMFIATMTTVGAFFPMLLGLKGSTREYIYSLPVTITVVLLLSWVMAMTFCTLLAYWFIRAPEDPDEPLSPIALLIRRFKGKKPQEGPKKEGVFTRAYAALAHACLKARFLVVLISFGSLGFVMQLEVGSEFFPADIRNQFAVEVWLDDSASIEQTNEATRRVEEALRKLSPHTDAEGQPVERLRAYRAMIGKGGARWYLGRNPEPAQPQYAELMVWTTDGLLTNDYVRDIRRVCVEGDERLGIEPLAGVRVIPRQLVMGPATEAPIGVRIYGAGFADMAVLREQGEKLKALLRRIPGGWDIHDVWGSPSYELQVKVDEDKANLAGVSNASVAQTLNAYFEGHYLTTFRENDYLIPVYLRLPPSERASVAELKSPYVEGLQGKVPLDALATVEPRWMPSRIGRRFKNRMFEVRARVEPGFRSNDIVNQLFDSQEFKDWEAALPPGYWWEAGGDMFESEVTAAELKVSILISLASIVLLLIIQYNGLGKPIIILTTLPLALIGAFLGLYVMGYPLGFMPQLGLLSLFGIVVNTAIIFIEFADSLVEERARASDGSGPILGLTKMEFRQCLVDAGNVRLLPIAMTTLTTIGGLLPLALFGGPMWEGMSWLMIYGLAVATVLTLIVVPALYAIFVENFKMDPLPTGHEITPAGVDAGAVAPTDTGTIAVASTDAVDDSGEEALSES